MRAFGWRWNRAKPENKSLYPGPISAFLTAVRHPEILDHIRCREKGGASGAPVFPALDGNHARVLADLVEESGSSMIAQLPAKLDGTGWVPAGDFRGIQFDLRPVEDSRGELHEADDFKNPSAPPILFFHPEFRDSVGLTAIRGFL